jgi:hypothetical protein
MSLFRWLFRDSRRTAALPESSGLSRAESTRPVGAGAMGTAQPANRKSERMARRELLYRVVREAMVHAGVLSASYKFKVLSLDARGRQFLVMVDLARESASDPQRLAEVEALIAQAAKSRYDIVVTAVYWRSSDHVAIGDRGAQAPSAAARAEPPTQDHKTAAPAAGPVGRDAKAAAPVTTGGLRRTGSPFEPIRPDEVAAFKRALAVGAVEPVAASRAAARSDLSGSEAGEAVSPRPQSYALLTGFEDTEMPDGEHRRPILSGTQYGDLN